MDSQAQAIQHAPFSAPNALVLLLPVHPLAFAFVFSAASLPPIPAGQNTQMATDWHGKHRRRMRVRDGCFPLADSVRHGEVRTALSAHIVVH